jgi:hypothetical protein
LVVLRVAHALEPCRATVLLSIASIWKPPEDENGLERFHGWYDRIVQVSEDPTFECRLAGHVETDDDSRIRRSADW